jgi:capsular exopolysaccharide synthesis family protein
VTVTNPVPPRAALRISHEALRCPASGQKLHQDGTALVSDDGSRRYPVVDGVPVLIDDDRSLFSAAEVAASASRAPPRPGVLRSVARALTPATTSNHGAAARLQRFAQLVRDGASQRPARVLVVGGGGLGAGMDVLASDGGVELWETDVYLSPRVVVACDGHRLPFADGTFDGAVAQAVLEHVLEPQTVVDEIHRVLAPAGVVYAETPFMQQVHEGTFDFTRFTDLGHRRLFRRFDEIERGVAVGPGSALLWASRYLARSLPRRPGPAVLVLDRLATLALFWLRFLDRLLADRPGACDAASGLYFVGRRRDDAVGDRAIVAGYRGAVGSVATARGLEARMAERGTSSFDFGRELAAIPPREHHGGHAHPADLATRLNDLRRWWWVVVLCTGFAALYAYAVSTGPPQYDATASLLFRDPAIDQKLFPGTVFTPSEDPQRTAATNIELVSLDAVARRVATSTPGLTEQEVRDSVKVRADGNSDVVTVTGRRPTAVGAARLANRYASEYIKFRRDADRAKILEAARLVSRQLDRLGPAQRKGAQGRVLAQQDSELNTLAAVQTGNAEIVEVADPPPSPAAPRPKRNAAIGGTFGALLGIGMLLLLGRLDQRVRSSKEAAALLDAPLLTEVAPDSRLESRPLPGDMVNAATTEPFRVLRTTLRYFTVGDRSLTTVLVTSAVPGEGKTTTAWNLALAGASDGDAVLVIEADLRRPRMLPDWETTGPGLAAVLAGLTSFEHAVTSVHLNPEIDGTGAGRLDVLAAGVRPPNPLQLLQSGRMRELLHDVAGRYDLVVLDSPAVTAVGDALALVRDVDGVVAVARMGSTTRGDLDALARSLDNVAATLVGVVVNSAKDRPNYYYPESDA